MISLYECGHGVGDCQRRFRFEKDKYADKGEYKTSTKIARILLAGGILGALLAD
jgi:hypothetical protein